VRWLNWLQPGNATYTDIPGAYSFLPIAIETHGAMNAAAYDFFHDVGHRVSKVTGDA